jgi:hypothetical protein
MAGKSDRAAILGRLWAEIDGGRVIYDALCGSGITAKMAARGGASMVTTHSLVEATRQFRGIRLPKILPPGCSR